MNFFQRPAELRGGSITVSRADREMACRVFQDVVDAIEPTAVASPAGKQASTRKRVAPRISSTGAESRTSRPRTRRPLGGTVHHGRRVTRRAACASWISWSVRQSQANRNAPPTLMADLKARKATLRITHRRLEGFEPWPVGSAHDLAIELQDSLKSSGLTLNRSAPLANCVVKSEARQSAPCRNTDEGEAGLGPCEHGAPAGLPTSVATGPPELPPGSSAMLPKRQAQIGSL